MNGEYPPLLVACSILLAPATPQEAGPVASEPRQRLPNERTPTHTILLVEDNLANVRVVERLFGRNRPQVRLLTAMQGGIALDLAAEHRPDLVLLDFNLPDMAGDDVLHQLRETDALRTTPVVIVSGDATASQVQRLLDLGAAAYITKPFEIRELLKVVDDLLEVDGDRRSSH